MIRGTQPNLACTKDPLTRRGLPVQTATFREHSRTPVTPEVFRRLSAPSAPAHLSVLRHSIQVRAHTHSTPMTLFQRFHPESNYPARYC